MKLHPATPLCSVAACTLLLASCVDSKTPLSDPTTSAADDRLAGVWRLSDDNNGTAYFHIGRVVAQELPPAMMRVTGIAHTKNGEMQLEQCETLIFPTTIGDQTYLNVVGDGQTPPAPLKEKGWQADKVETYTILRYQIVDDVLSIKTMDWGVAKKAITSGKIKGITKTETGWSNVRFTDTVENLAKFVAEAGDKLFPTEALSLQRVK